MYFIKLFIILNRSFCMPEVSPSKNNGIQARVEVKFCAPTLGGLVLQAQFWDAYTGLETQGQLLPKDSWTIQVLWPDTCDGLYEQYCEFSWKYDPDPSPAKLPNGTTIPPYNGSSVETSIVEFERPDLLDYMNKYWINQGAPNTEFWAHEVLYYCTISTIGSWGVTCDTDFHLVHWFIVACDAVQMA
ncbi:hypothetical protein AcV5_003449 [Taiwanofungus camphoratus]|nr:hypothetical protein AcV5_003449 [Antrodia cinnamomea]